MVQVDGYRASQVTGQRQLELVERKLVEPAPGSVRIRVQACGVCHSDVLAVDGMRPDPSLPIVPGHEVVGVIDAVGAGVRAWTVGDHVGVGYLGGQCGECQFCRRGDFVNCLDQPQVGTTHDGGYAEVVYVRASGLVRLPAGIDNIAAAPLLCAGIGGLGHLGIQYAKEFGYRTVAIARGPDKAELAKRLGADDYIDSEATDPAEVLQEQGGAAAIVATAASGSSMSALPGGLAPRGKLIVVGAAFDPIEVHTPDLVFGARSIVGTLTGSIDNEDNLAFSAARGITPMVEVSAFEDAPAAYERMMANEARFRIVLDIATR
jgi:alcohol dehydrogenase, propanol-preferring